MFQKISLTQSLYIWYSLLWRYVFMFLMCSILFGLLRGLSQYLTHIKPQFTGVFAWFLGVMAFGCKFICLPLLIFGWVYILYRFLNRPDIQAMFYKKSDITVQPSDPY